MKGRKGSEFNPWVRKIPLEEEMATHSSTLARKIPWTEEPGRLHSMGSQRVGYDCAVFSSRVSLFLFFFFEASSQNCGSLCHGYSLVIMQVTSLTWWGFQYVQDSVVDIAQKIIYSPWGGTTLLNDKLLLFGLLWLFSFVSAFYHFSD